MLPVKSIPLGMLTAGAHTVSEDVHSLKSGIYIVLLQLPNTIMKTKIVIVK